VRRWPFASLRARLALWYLLVLVLVLAAFGAALYAAVRHSLMDGVDAALRARAATVIGQLDLDAPQLSYHGEDAPTADAEMGVYLFDVRGHLLHRIAGSLAMPPLPAALGLALRGDSGYATVDGSRLYAAGLRDARGRVQGAVQVIQSLGGPQDTLRELLALLALTVPVLLLAATAGGIFLAGRTLEPIDHIAATARRIGAGDLHERLGVAPRDDEVGRLAATFDGMLDRLERAFAQQRQLVADASHELRTPLAIVRSDLDILRRHPRPVPEHEAFERGLDEEVARLSRIVEDLLTLARADSGEAQLEREFLYLDTMVADVAAGLGRLAAAKGVALETCLEPDVAVVGDPARLRQLILNVAGNAVKYTPAGGQVRLTLRGEDAWACLEVADTGIGIAPDELMQVFDRFFRTDKARSRAEGGTGLGLSIARWCAEAHGGGIAVRSSPGRGSTFAITLPRAVTEE